MVWYPETESAPEVGTRYTVRVPTGADPYRPQDDQATRLHDELVATSEKIRFVERRLAVKAGTSTNLDRAVSREAATAKLALVGAIVVWGLFAWFLLPVFLDELGLASLLLAPLGGGLVLLPYFAWRARKAREYAQQYRLDEAWAAEVAEQSEVLLRDTLGRLQQQREQTRSELEAIGPRPALPPRPEDA